MENNISKVSDTEILITPTPETVSLTELIRRRNAATNQLKRIVSSNPIGIQKRIDHLNSLIAQAQNLGIKEDTQISQTVTPSA